LDELFAGHILSSLTVLRAKNLHRAMPESLHEIGRQTVVATLLWGGKVKGRTKDWLKLTRG
jgi:hypothetical protein